MGRSQRSGILGPAAWAALAVGLVLRVWEAAESSLWLDELHTLFHASRPDVSGVIQSVHPDNHTPLFFLLVHFAGGWSEGPWLRWIPIAASLAGLPLLVAILRDAGAGRTRIALAMWLWATMPYQIHYGAELRPYCLLTFFSVAAFWLAFTTRGPAALRFAGFLIACLAGLFSHMGMALTVLGIGAARLIVRRPGALKLPTLILSGALAVAGFMPWLLGFAHRAAVDRSEHYQEVGGYQLREVLRNELIQLPLRLVEPYVRFLGPPWAELAIAGTGLVALTLLVALALWLLAGVRAERAPPGQVDSGLVVFAFTVFLATTLLSWYRWDRVPLHYYSGMAWVLPLALSELSESTAERARPFLRAAFGLGFLVMGVALAGGKSRADVRGGVDQLVAWGRELEAQGQRPLYTARLSQPGEVFDDTLPFRAYAPEVEAVEPRDLPRPGQPGFQRPLLVFRRVLPLDHPKWAPVFDGRRIERQRQIDWYISVYELVPEEER